MDKEYTTSHQMGDYPKIILVLLYGFFPLLGIALLIISVYAFYATYVLEGYSLAYTLSLFAYMMLVSVFILILGGAYLSWGLARYRFEDIGLIAKYPFKKETIIPWENFQQVCVCYAAYTTRGERRANTVICCVKKGETKNWLGRWKTDNPFRHRSVICIDYKETLFNGLVEKYPGTVVDLRNTPEYRLNSGRHRT